MKRSFSASVSQEDSLFVAQCLEIDVASQGTSPEEAIENLREALALHSEQPTSTEVPEIHHFKIDIDAA